MLRAVKTIWRSLATILTVLLTAGCSLAYENSARDQYEISKFEEASPAFIESQLSVTLARLVERETYSTNMHGAEAVHDFTYAAFIWNRCGWSSISRGPTENWPDYTLTTRASRLPIIGGDDGCYDQFRDNLILAIKSVDNLEISRVAD
jgi:hypothetical protein